MIIPVLNKKSTALELANLCLLLNETKNTCVDSNLRWKLVQLADDAERLNEKFLEDFNLPSSNPSKYYKDILEKFLSEDSTEIYLSFAFQSAAVIDCARYEECEPDNEFRIKIKSIRTQTLDLLHEKKRQGNDDD